MNNTSKLRKRLRGERLSRAGQPAPDQSAQSTPLHDVSAIARRLGVSTKTVRRLISAHELRAYRVGRQLRISDEEYMRFLGGRG